MHWPILLISAIFEAIWATALGESNGFSELVPTVIFVAATIISMIGLGYAMKAIPVGTAYAVWTAVGSALTVTYAMASGNESASILKVLFLSGIIVCVVGLKLLPSEEVFEDTKDGHPETAV